MSNRITRLKFNEDFEPLIRYRNKSNTKVGALKLRHFPILVTDFQIVGDNDAKLFSVVACFTALRVLCWLGAWRGPTVWQNSIPFHDTRAHAAGGYLAGIL